MVVVVVSLCSGNNLRNSRAVGASYTGPHTSAKNKKVGNKTSSSAESKVFSKKTPKLWKLVLESEFFLIGYGHGLGYGVMSQPDKCVCICSDPLANPPVRELDWPVRNISSRSQTGQEVRELVSLCKLYRLKSL
jgi:hypothetical protein